MDSNMGMRGDLEITQSRWRPHDITKSWRLPFGAGRLLYTKDQGNSIRLANEQFQTHLSATHFDARGKIKEVRDIGSGIITNVGVLSIANDFGWASPSGSALNTLKLANNHAVGVGTNAANIINVALQTLAAPTTTTAVAGTQSLVAGIVGGDAASVQQYKSVATTNFSGSAAITEWGIFSNATLSATTGSPFTGGSGTTGVVTGTPLTASSTTVGGEQSFIFQDNTAVAPFWGMVTSNTTSTITVPAFYVVATGAVSGVSPQNADAYTILPIMLDRQVFSAINVTSGDSVQWSFVLQIIPGG